METESSTVGNDEQFNRRLDAFNHAYREQVYMDSCNCWSFLNDVAIAVKDFFLRRYIATIVLILSCSFLVASIAVLEDFTLVIGVVYCLSFIVSPVISLLVKKGCLTMVLKNTSEQPEQRRLLPELSHDQTAGYGTVTEDKEQPLQSTLESVMEPKLDFSFESSVGSSQSSDYADCFAVTYTSDDSSISYKPSQNPFVARVSADAVKAFGLPLQVFGADSLSVVSHSSDEYCSSNKALDFEPVVQVHHSDSYEPLNPGNDSFNSAGPSTSTNDESGLSVGFDLHSDLPYVPDDESSEST